MYRPGGVRPPGRRPDHHRGQPSDSIRAPLPLPLREGAGGRVRRPDRGPPSPQPPPGGGGSCLPSYPSSPRPASCSPPSAPCSTRLPARPLPPRLHRHRDPRPPGPPAGPPARGGRHLALPLGQRPAAVHRPAGRGRGPALLVPSRRRSARPDPRHRAAAPLGPYRLRRLHACDAGRSPARAAPAHHALEADRDGPRRAARGALRPTWRARHLADARAVRRQLEGIRAGSLAWFGVPPEALEPAQAALLVAIPRRPERLRPDRHADGRTRDARSGAGGGHPGRTCSMPHLHPRPYRPPASPLPPPRAATRAHRCPTRR